MNFPKFWAQGRSGNFSSWRWSNTGMEEAQKSATEAAERLAAQFAQQDGALDRYGYGNRPLREPVLREVRDAGGDVSAVITRNSYGCQVLNTARAMFVDVDLPAASPATKLVGVFGSLFGQKAEAPQDPAQAAVAKAENWARRQANWNWRIYRTHSGLRLLATHALFDPADGVCQSVFDAVDADPLYRKLCQTQECFRARLTPKPWRCKVGHPPARWPFTDSSAERAFTTWDAGYQSACRLKASCQLLTAGNGHVHPDLQSLVALHDEMTRATTQLPLA